LVYGNAIVKISANDNFSNTAADCFVIEKEIQEYVDNLVSKNICSGYYPSLDSDFFFAIVIVAKRR